MPRRLFLKPNSSHDPNTSDRVHPATKRLHSSAAKRTHSSATYRRITGLLRSERIIKRRTPQIPNPVFKFAYGLMLTFGMASLALAEDNAVQQPSAREQLQRI